LETAIMDVPFVIIYKMGILNYLLYRPQVKIPYIGMVNIVGGKRIIDEYIQFKAKPKVIAKRVIEILKNKQKAAVLKKKLETIKSKLGEPNAAHRAAQFINNSL
jgi:lipid-A-disaccharide synthase